MCIPLSFDLLHSAKCACTCLVNSEKNYDDDFTSLQLVFSLFFLKHNFAKQIICIFTKCCEDFKVCYFYFITWCFYLSILIQRNFNVIAEFTNQILIDEWDSCNFRFCVSLDLFFFGFNLRQLLKLDLQLFKEFFFRYLHFVLRKLFVICCFSSLITILFVFS